ncbi:MAG: hypothetical protein OJF51_003131 [Nitrospira sp.]|jgi:predicted nucleic acid-binding protein|nr:MAG: hypothetical protein OJF51_003131 [Nitrospira sp.]
MPSFPISRKPEKLVIDANPILSALLGGKANSCSLNRDITEFAVADSVIEEVKRYLPKVAEKLGVSLDFLAYALDLLPLTICSQKSIAAL